MQRINKGAKGAWRWFAKVLLGGMIAFLLLNVVCFFYYNPPVRVPAEDGVTDYTWEHNKLYFRATEGFSFGRTNNEGYMNSFDYVDGMNIDVLVMGSSNMEGYCEMMSKSTASVLGDMMPDKTVYNISISGHTFDICADNLEAALDKYSPSYVVIEASNLLFSDERLNQIIDGTVPEIESYFDGVVGFLQKIPLLRLYYSQLSLYMNNQSSAQAAKTSGSPSAINYELYGEMLDKLSDIAAERGAQLIIVYHENLSLNAQGEVSNARIDKFRTNFAQICSENGICYIDMVSEFIDSYNSDRKLPHGFANSSIGSGHLNKHGLRLIAESIYEQIKEGE